MAELRNETNGLEVKSEFRLAEYVHARATEMEAMTAAALKARPHKKGSANSAPRQLPVHMRRRAASHNIKRLPRKLRQKALFQMKDKPKTTKTPSRKHRRRPKNLLEDYNRRKRNKIWLETHIWHAKRFHMVEKWGYKIAHYANDKGARACYRASAHYCQLWDMSYLCCVEISGPQDELIERLSLLTPRETGPTFGSLAYTRGSVEGKLCLYQRKTYPFCAIGPITFQWKPLGSPFGKEGAGTGTGSRTLWIWCHPSIHERVIDELVALFSLSKCDTALEKSLKEKSDHAPSGTDSNCNSVYRKYPKVPNKIYRSKSVTVTLLRDTLCRFKLRGPLSHSTMLDTLLVADTRCEVQATAMEVDEDDDAGDRKSDLLWWKSAYAQPEAVRIHQQQRSVYAELKKLPSAGHLPSGVVVGLTVRDPRLFLPKKKTMVVSSADAAKTTSEEDTSNRPETSFDWPDVSQSPLWESVVRDNVKDTMFSDQEINQKRSENLIPGSPLELGDEESRIPVMAIHTPSQQISASGTLSAYGTGWDIVVPGGWAMPFLVAMVYRGARVGGLRELRNSDFEMGHVHFPCQYPDTEAGRREEEDVKSILETRHKKKPPAKRVNFEKLGVLEPFHNPWKRLMSEWCAAGNGDSCQFAVLRDRNTLSQLQNCICQPENCASLPRMDYCLVPVKLDVVSRGCCDSMSFICLPTLDDLQQLRNNPSYTGPTEPIKHIAKSGLLDTNQKEKIVDVVATSQSGLIKHCSRETIGFIAEGGFSYKLGHGVGIGFVAMQGFSLAVATERPRAKNGSVVVLVRSPTTCQYRFVQLSVLV